jgi:hypothetical protein
MRMPACRRPLALTAALGALALGTPTLAQTEGAYEYAQPAPDAPVIFRSDPMVQALPEPPAPPPPPLPPTVDEADTVEAVDLPPPLPPVPPVPPHPPVAYAAPGYAPAPATYPAPYPGGPVYAAPYPAYGYGDSAPAFDRDAWLADCHDRIRGVDRADRAGVIGGLLGAVAGGVIGNRAWDSHRLAATLLGAGVGGLAGVAIGAAIGAADERHRDDECAYYLDRAMAGGYPQGGYAYGYGGYALVPVLVAVPQRQVVRETVTEEWVDEPVRARSIPRVQSRPAPRGDKRIKLIKGN